MVFGDDQPPIPPFNALDQFTAANRANDDQTATAPITHRVNFIRRRLAINSLKHLDTLRHFSSSSNSGRTKKRGRTSDQEAATSADPTSVEGQEAPSTSAQTESQESAESGEGEFIALVGGPPEEDSRQVPRKKGRYFSDDSKQKEQLTRKKPQSKRSKSSYQALVDDFQALAQSFVAMQKEREGEEEENVNLLKDLVKTAPLVDLAEQEPSAQPDSADEEGLIIDIDDDDGDGEEQQEQGVKNDDDTAAFVDEVMPEQSSERHVAEAADEAMDVMIIGSSGGSKKPPAPSPLRRPRPRPTMTSTATRRPDFNSRAQVTWRQYRKGGACSPTNSTSSSSSSRESDEDEDESAEKDSKKQAQQDSQKMTHSSTTSPMINIDNNDHDDAVIEVMDDDEDEEEVVVIPSSRRLVAGKNRTRRPFTQGAPVIQIDDDEEGVAVETNPTWLSSSSPAVCIMQTIQRAGQPGAATSHSPPAMRRLNWAAAQKANKPCCDPLKRRSHLADSSIVRSRRRFPAPAQQINTHVVGMNFDLLGLRYLQRVDGQELIKLSTPKGQERYASEKLTVASYNVLCQSSMQRTGELYGHLAFNNRQHLGEWTYRRELIRSELARLPADIYCLQEVENDHYTDFYAPLFEAGGFAGTFTQRTGTYPDGCATFYAKEKLELLRSVDVKFNLGVPGMDRDNVGQVHLFELKSIKALLCVANTHLLFNMRRGDIKLAQLVLLIAEIHKLCDGEIPPTKFFAGHLLCGDFNLDPNSPLYSFLTDAHVELGRHSSWELARAPSQQAAYSGGNPVTEIPLQWMGVNEECVFEAAGDKGTNSTSTTGENRGHLTHALTLSSVYEHRTQGGMLEISTYHRNAGNPDFIFYSSAGPSDPTAGPVGSVDESHLRLLRRLSLPTLPELNATCGRMPNEQTGSDHLPLLAEFQVLRPTEKAHQQRRVSFADSC